MRLPSNVHQVGRGSRSSSHCSVARAAEGSSVKHFLLFAASSSLPCDRESLNTRNSAGAQSSWRISRDGCRQRLKSVHVFQAPEECARFSFRPDALSDSPADISRVVPSSSASATSACQSPSLALVLVLTLGAGLGNGGVSSLGALACAVFDQRDCHDRACS